MGIKRKPQPIPPAPPSPRAMCCYRELVRFVDQHGVAPSFAELGEILHCSTSTVGRYLDALQRAGLVSRRGRRARSIVIKQVAT